MFRKISTLAGCAAIVGAAMITVNAQGTAQPAQSSATPPASPDEHVVANPNYVSIHLEVDVNRSAADVWKRVGKYCDIGEWFQVAAGCKILSGPDNDVGAVRSIANEVLVGKTELSYTYTQPVRAGRPYNLYHGTLEARPVTATTSKLLYTLVFGLGAALAGLAGLMQAPILTVQIGMGESILILAFVITVIGGIGSIRGALVAAILVGFIDTLGRAFFPDLLRLAFTKEVAATAAPALSSMLIYLLMAIVLIVKPEGLFSAGGK